MFTRILSAAASTALAVSLVTIGSAPATAASGGLLTALSARTEYRLGEPVTLTFELRNTTGRDNSVLAWDTPLEHETLDYLRVRRDDREVPYDGRVFKRAKPDQSAYRVLHPGESVRETFDLTTAYGLTEPGDYTATLTTHLEPASATFRVLPGGPARSTAAESIRRADATGPRAAAGPKFEQVSQQRKPIVKRAVKEADKYVQLASTALRSAEDSDHYRTWFGTFDGDRHDTVANHFKEIGHDADDTTYHGDCDKPKVFAYVYPNTPGHLWLCPAFWTAPMTGTDSQCGTIVHEQSHFTVNGGTEDYTYGQSNCQSLAENDPNKAVENADSHEYYAENNPPQ